MPEEAIYISAATWVDIPGGWVTLMVAFLTVVVGPIATVIVTARLSGKVRDIKSDVVATKRDAAIARDQVANNHIDPETGQPINLREEQDARHHEVTDRLTEIRSILEDHSKDIGGIRHDIRNLYAADGEQVRQQNRDRERIDQLEHTIPRDELGRFIKKETE
jgi:hypothetical protein